MKHLSAVLMLLVGLAIGSLATLHAERKAGGLMYDKNGKAVRVGDIVLPDGPNAVPIKIHGFTVIYEPGTYAGYGHQFSACKDCQWVETNPNLGDDDEYKKDAANRERVPMSNLEKFTNWLVPPVSASGSTGVAWGS